jgi:hypothetical protein
VLQAARLCLQAITRSRQRPNLCFQAITSGGERANLCLHGGQLLACRVPRLLDSDVLCAALLNQLLQVCVLPPGRRLQPVRRGVCSGKLCRSL